MGGSVRPVSVSQPRSGGEVQFGRVEVSTRSTSSDMSATAARITSFSWTPSLPPTVGRWSSRPIRLSEGILAGLRVTVVVPAPAQRRAQPKDDLISALVGGADDGDRLNDEELAITAALLLAAGFETTTGLLANGLLALLTYPDQARRLRERQNSRSSASRTGCASTGPRQPRCPSRRPAVEHTRSGEMACRVDLTTPGCVIARRRPRDERDSATHRTLVPRRIGTVRVTLALILGPAIGNVSEGHEMA